MLNNNYIALWKFFRGYTVTYLENTVWMYEFREDTFVVAFLHRS